MELNQLVTSFFRFAKIMESSGLRLNGVSGCGNIVSNKSPCLGHIGLLSLFLEWLIVCVICQVE